MAQVLALTIDGLLRSVAGDVDTARARYAQALEIQQRLGEQEAAGLSLGGLAALAAGGGESALDL